MKILVSAYACEPGKGSEPGVGWNAALGLSKHHEVWVITRENNREAIESEIRKNPSPNLHFVYYDLPKWISWWKNKQFGVRLYYYLWQIGIFFLARNLFSKTQFDVIHHVTFVNYHKPSFLSLLPAPFVWGPVGGGESAPKSFWSSFGVYGFFYEVARSFTRWLEEFDPFLKITAKRSWIAFATTHDTATRLRELGVKNVKILSEAALSEENISILKNYKVPDDSVFRFISLGRLLHWKGFYLGIEAFAKSDLKDVSEYWIVGSGPDRHRLETLAKDLKVSDRVHFLGNLTRAEALEKLALCHVLVHPSLHDSGGWVCLEAMAAKRVVLCLDSGGPGQQVTEDSGIKVPVFNQEQVVIDLSHAMRSIYENKRRNEELAKCASERIEAYYTLCAQNQEILNAYEQILAQKKL